MAVWSCSIKKVFSTGLNQPYGTISASKTVYKQFLFEWDVQNTHRCYVIVKHVDNVNTITDGRTTLKRVGYFFF